MNRVDPQILGRALLSRGVGAAVMKSAPEWCLRCSSDDVLPTGRGRGAFPRWIMQGTVPWKQIPEGGSGLLEEAVSSLRCIARLNKSSQIPDERSSMRMRKCVSRTGCIAD